MKTIRIGVYGLIELNNKIVVIKKSRGPFTGKFDLPGGKIEHGEDNKNSLIREIGEELGLKEKDIEIKKLFSIEEDFIKYVWDKDIKDEHIIAIIYKVLIKGNLDFNYFENGGDSCGIYLIDNKKSILNTNILNNLLEN